MSVLVRLPRLPRRVWLLQDRDISGLPGTTGGTEQLTHGSPDAGKDPRGLGLCGSLGIGFRNAVAGILSTAAGANCYGVGKSGGVDVSRKPPSIESIRRTSRKTL